MAKDSLTYDQQVDKLVNEKGLAMPDTPLHAKLGIPKNDGQHTMGKRDLFGAVISLRYLLPPDQFLPFKRRLARLIDEFARDCAAIKASELLALMGFPKNWTDLTRYEL